MDICYFLYTFVYENPSDEDLKNPYCKGQGYIDVEWIKNNIDAIDAEYYVCGPVPFLKAIISSLKTLGVPESNIHFEFFGPSMNLED